jgi:transketolase
MNNNVRETFTETIYEVGIRDDRLCCIVSDISHFRLQRFAQACPGRYFNLGVCENSIINVAAGMAHLGFIPVVHTFASFLIDRSYEQIKVSFGYQRLPVNLVVIGSGLEYSFHGVTHHSYADGAMLKTIENSTVFNPGSTLEFATLFSANYDNGKINLFRATTKPHGIDLSDHRIEAGKGILIQEGTDITLFCTGAHLSTAVDSVAMFEERGMSPEIIYFHTLKPIDADLVCASVKKTGRFITMEHQSKYGGLHDDVLRTLVDGGVSEIRGTGLNLGDSFVHEYGSFAQHDARLGFTAENLVQKADELCGARVS